MSETFFPSPPRPAGIGWRRRFRQGLLWLLIGAAVIASFLYLAQRTERTSIEARRIAREGERRMCTVLSKRHSDGKTKSYYVTLAVDGPPRLPALERSVIRSEWLSVEAGSKSTWYCDPKDPAEGFSELERPTLESMKAYYASLGVAITMALAVVVALRILWQQMRLLANGVELVTQGMGREARISHEGRTIPIRTPADPENHIQQRAEVGPRGLVVLASPDLSRHYFPRLIDVPLDRLIGAARPIEARLPLPPRLPQPGWDRGSHAGISSLMATAIFLVLMGIVLLAGMMAKRGFPIPEIVASIAGPGAALLLAGWAWRRGRRRRLWREGQELHAVILQETAEKRARRYDLAWTARDEELRGSARLPRGVGPWEPPAPGDDPAVVRRAVILVDPERPQRWTIVPAESGRA